jgi:putative effector of murein hydrolase
MHSLVLMFQGVRASPLFGPGLTLLAYEAAILLQIRAKGSVLLNPVLIATAILIAFLGATGIPLHDYLVGADAVALLLGPAAVALAVPLYRQAVQFRRQAIPLCVACLTGCAVSSLSAVAIAVALGAPGVVVRSIAPKSATVAIAVGVSSQIGGQPALTAAFTIGTGILTAAIAKYVLDAASIRRPFLRGLAIGTAGHGIGTAYALGVDAETGAFSGLGMSLAGVATGLFLPGLWCLIAALPWVPP